MKKRGICLSVAAASAIVPNSGFASFANRFLLTDLGAAPSHNYTKINNRGQVATTLSGRISLWTPAAANGLTGAWTTLPTPIITSNTLPGLPPTTYPSPNVAMGINDYGQVVGNLGDSVNSGKSYVWTPNAPHSTEGEYLLGALSYATSTSINAFGQVVTYTNPSPSGPLNTLWTPAVPNGSAGSSATLNASGGAWVINSRGDVAFRHGGGIATVFRPEMPRGATGTYASFIEVVNDMNDSGWVAGTLGIHVPSTTGTLTYTKLADGPRYAVAINNSNEVLTEDRFIWSEDEGSVSLAGRLETHSSRGWALTSMLDMNELGQIVGKASFDPDANPATNNSIERTILLTPLVAGDANVDQRVDFDDLLRVAQHYGETNVSSWHSGDFDGDGVVDFSDLLALAQTYGYGGASVVGSDFSSDWALAQSLVPEPASVVFFAAIAFRRRSRRIA